jgi:predicted DNA-binding transcriptional regulator AlpA
VFLQKKTTWFWQMRKDGLLPCRKIGKSIYYSKKEINQLLETSKQN